MAQDLLSGLVAIFTAVRGDKQITKTKCCGEGESPILCDRYLDVVHSYFLSLHLLRVADCGGADLKILQK